MMLTLALLLRRRLLHPELQLLPLVGLARVLLAVLLA
jgi:hypothetical protein